MGLHRLVLVTLQCSPREALTLHFLFPKKTSITLTLSMTQKNMSLAKFSHQKVLRTEAFG